MDVCLRVFCRQTCTSLRLCRVSPASDIGRAVATVGHGTVGGGDVSTLGFGGSWLGEGAPTDTSSTSSLPWRVSAGQDRQTTALVGGLSLCWLLLLCGSPLAASSCDFRSDMPASVPRAKRRNWSRLDSGLSVLAKSCHRRAVRSPKVGR